MTFGPARVVFAQATTEDQSGRDDDYNQWKLSLGAAAAPDPATFTVLPGFRVELVCTAGPNDGSWIALAFDAQGRAIISREDQGLLRTTLPVSARLPASNGFSYETVDNTLRECRGLLWVHGSLYANANNSKGLYRLRDADGDGKFEDVMLLRETAGGVGHGRNDLALGPDGDIYLIHGDDVRLPADFDPARGPLRHYADARLFPCSWDQNLFNASMMLPGGHVIRTDRDGKKWDLVAGGLRNPYGIDFNADGEMFTFDADMEWDVGMPWYRPTRVLHLVSGGDYGWRHGTGPWPAWYPDSLPATLDLGLGSPTAVRFGTKTNYPLSVRHALFVADWSYGRILMVRLEPHGASYRAAATPMVTGRPLNVTDLEVGPDQCLYFLTGGRKTKSALYRIRYTYDGHSSDYVPPGLRLATSEEKNQADHARHWRRQLVAFHQQESLDALDFAIPALDQEDVWLRHAARVALENQPLANWLPQVWAEKRTRVRAGLLLAVSRVGSAEVRDPLVDAVCEFPWQDSALDQQLAVLRAATVGLARHGKPDAGRCDRLRQTFERLYPSKSPEANFLLCELLAFLESPQVVAKTLALMQVARGQEEKIRYLYVLRNVRAPWTERERRRYFASLREAREFYGAHLLPRFIGWIKSDAEATLSDSERTALADVLRDELPASGKAAPVVERPHVRNWIFQDLVGSLDGKWDARDKERGQAAFDAALCGKCHRLAGRGSPLGPDLAGLSRRFGRREILLSILHPSQVIDEKYQAITVTTTSGRVLAGQRLSETETHVTLAPNPLAPDHVERIAKSNIETIVPSNVSPMPAGLLNTLSKDEILDLLAYLESASAGP